MSDLVQIENADEPKGSSRRDWLRGIATTATLAAALPLQAQHEHHQMPNAPKPAKPTGPFKPKALTPQEYKTVQLLSGLIIPADERDGGALEAGAPEYIDHMCSVSQEMKDVYTGGLAWMDRLSQDRYTVLLTEASPAQQTELLNLVAYKRDMAPELAAGIRFFSWIRKMVVDAYYTSKAGTVELGYIGNKGMAEFKVPEECINYALERSKLA